VVEIRVDRRVLMMLLVLIGIGVPLGIGLLIGTAVTEPDSVTAPPQAGATSPLVVGTPVIEAPADPLGTELPPDVAAAVPRAEIADVAGRLDDPNLLVVDARTEGEYTTSHVPGAISMPVDQVEARLSELPTDKEIVFYCA
jgi:hypothetical protein